MPLGGLPLPGGLAARAAVDMGAEQGTTVYDDGGVLTDQFLQGGRGLDEGLLRLVQPAYVAEMLGEKGQGSGPLVLKSEIALPLPRRFVDGFEQGADGRFRGIDLTDMAEELAEVEFGLLEGFSIIEVAGMSFDEVSGRRSSGKQGRPGIGRALSAPSRSSRGWSVPWRFHGGTAAGQADREPAIPRA